MKITELMRLVWINLSQNKFKVILTSIGIVVGSATIMMVIAIGSGSKEEVARQFQNLNAGAIDISYESTSFDSSAFSMAAADGSTISFTMKSEGMGSMGGAMRGDSSGSGSSTQMPGGSGMGGFSIFGDSGGIIMGGGTDDSDRMNQENITLSTDDMDDLAVFVPDISDATISYTTSASIEGGELDSSSTYTIAGVLENYADLSNLELYLGDFITADQNDTKEKVCVLGYSTAKEIFDSAYDAYNSTIYIDDRPYVVVGILSEMGTVASGISPDTAVFIPYETGVKYLTGGDESPTITVIADDVDNISTVVANVESVLADSYPNAEFTITDAGTKMEAASASNETLTLLLFAMAAIVFIVGGIGIMNVLFVSVKERTNEIGILKALGCSRKDILMEFLFEATCMSFVGAVLGVLISLGITPIVEKLGVSVILTVQGACISLLFGVVTGSVFGFYPAFKASRLIPVVALNHE